MSEEIIEITSVLSSEPSILSDLTDGGSSLTSNMDKGIPIEYIGVESDNIIVSVNNDKFQISANLKPIRFDSINEFPDVGSEKLIYIANDTKALYCWSEENGYEKLVAEVKIPTNLSEFVNDGDGESPFVTNYDLNYKLSSALLSYYTKNETDEKLLTKQNKISSTNMVSSDFIDDNANTHKFVTAEEKEVWNNKSDFSGDYNDLTNKPNIPDTSNFVTTNTEQTITALKTFKQGSSTNYVALGVDIDNTPALQVGFDGFGRFQKFQDKSGTIALTSDIPTSVGIKLRRWS